MPRTSMTSQTACPRKKNFWKKLLTKTAIWVASEILLNAVGIDNLADYSEFVFAAERFILTSSISTATTSMPPLQIQANGIENVEIDCSKG